MGISKGLQGQRRTTIEWPTLVLAAVIYGGWAALTLFHDSVPVWFLVPAGAWLVAWHSSLQHEIIHFHPTRWAGFNRALALLPLSLWLPYECYRQSHLVHHRDERLTDPFDDPESAYLAPEQWQAHCAVARSVIGLQTTLLGRLVLGPPWRIARFLIANGRAALAGDRATLLAWAEHLPGVALVVFWLGFVCEMNLSFYLIAVVYPGTSLLLLRSFAEHRAAYGVLERTAVVENAWLFGPLFLFNNLHAAHHERPALTWYKLPGYYRANRERLLAGNGGLIYDGYGEIARRFLMAPHDTPAHPCCGPSIVAEAKA
jgi:fatty acid desaturase